MNNNHSNTNNTNSATKNKSQTQSQSNRTHYEVLGIEETSDFNTIKNAHRKLALQYHPDKLLAKNNSNKKKTDCVDLNEDENNDSADEHFKRIQSAWECLGDEKKRREYDDTLSRVRERNDGNFIKAQTVKLSEMECEICDVEDDSDHDDEDKETDATQTQKLYCYKCRCGDDFEILEEELNPDQNGEACEQRNIFQCASCSLLINVIV